MFDKVDVAAAVARLRLDADLTQKELAERAGISRGALGSIERGQSMPRAVTLRALAKALNVSVGELLAPVRPLTSVRLRARRRLHSPQQILAEVARWLDAYVELETVLGERQPFRLAGLQTKGVHGTPEEVARRARTAIGLPPGAPVENICGLLDEAGVKLLCLGKRSDSFFGLSVGRDDGGPAVVVNTWDRISVERSIFTAAHELGHILLHPSQYGRYDPRLATTTKKETEGEADAFAGEFLMPEDAFGSEWEATEGHSLIVRVLKVKRIFRVSYKTVLYRLVASSRCRKSVWRQFQMQHKRRFGQTLQKADEPMALDRSEFAWDWRRSGEPERLSRFDFVDDRFSRLVRHALKNKLISLGRAAEIMRLSLPEMRRRILDWRF